MRQERVQRSPHPQCFSDFMRFALQRLPTRLLALRIVCNAATPVNHTARSNHRRYQSCIASVENQAIGTWNEKREGSGGAEEYNGKNGGFETTANIEKHGDIVGQPEKTPLPAQRVVVGTIEQHGGKEASKVTRSLVSFAEYRKKSQGWRKHLSTFEQYQYESDLEASRDDRNLLVYQEPYAGDGRLWLELIRFRKRFSGAQGIQVLFKEIFRRGMLLPTSGAIGNELWELAVMGGHQHPQFLREVISYAWKVKQTTGEAWPKLYFSIVKHALKTDPTLAYDMHLSLKNHFPPSIDDYLKLFQLCVSWDSIDDFEGLYRDLPLWGMYTTVIRELARLHKFRDAVKWHNLLFTFGDLPSAFADMHPILAHLIRAGDSHQLEQIANDLREVCGETSPMTGATERFVRKHSEISRETFNRQLGEVHGVAPKHMSDGFCARLFATKLFSVDTVISGFQTVGVDGIGPLAMREMASRDDCDPIAIRRHLSRLKNIGVSPDGSAFSTLLKDLAFKNEQKLIRSLIECDLHPDTFEDQNLQERLLAQYFDWDDQLQVERTLAAITVRCHPEALQKWRLNLILRSQITLHREEAVVSTMQKMAQKNVPITVRSSRHLHVTWLTARKPGITAHSTHELSIIINAMKSTLRSGRYVQIDAWKEILSRLGMAGRLDEFEKLALWLVEFYTRPTIDGKLVDHALSWQHQRKGVPGKSHHPQAFLNKLFTIAAQHAIVAWGFQQYAKQAFSISRFRTEYMKRVEQRPFWVWGLVLLRRLQARGVPILKSTVARICKLRLVMIFGQGRSNRRVNRRSVWLKNQHDRALDRWALRFYIREMRDIWGKDLFQRQMQVSLVRTLTGPPRGCRFHQRERSKRRRLSD